MKSVKNTLNCTNTEADKPDSLLGCRFGHLTVQKHLCGVNYACQCDCGNVISVSKNNLLRGHQKSCGCTRHARSVEDITGMRSGKLVAIEPTDLKRRGCYLWRCRCDCGKELLVEPYKIRSRSVRSCGCSRIGKSICEQTYYRWQKRLLEMARRQQERRFAEITPERVEHVDGIAVTVRVAGAEVDICSGADAATVETVLRILKSC